MYGMSAFRLANELQIPQKEAKTFIENYFARFNGVQTFMIQVREQAEATGKVATLLGRERAVPEIRSGNRMERAGAERVVVNTVIQGTAADIIKLAWFAWHEGWLPSGVKADCCCQSMMN